MWETGGTIRSVMGDDAAMEEDFLQLRAVLPKLNRPVSRIYLKSRSLMTKNKAEDTMQLRNKNVKWLLVGCILIVLLAAGVLIALHAGNRDEATFSREQLMQISPATRIEYCQAGEVQSCVVYSDAILNNLYYHD